MRKIQLIKEFQEDGVQYDIEGLMYLNKNDWKIPQTFVQKETVSSPRKIAGKPKK